MARRSEPPVVTVLDDVEKCEKEAVEGLLAVPEGRPVTIVINSGGGSVYASLAIATVIRTRRLDATAVVLADCSSSALLIFAACPHRRVAPHASFLFHPMRWTSEEQSRLPGARSWSAEFDRLARTYEQWLTEFLPIDVRTLRSWIRHERYIEAPEMARMGIAELLEMPPPHIVIQIARRAAPRKKDTRRAAGRQSARVRRVG